MKKILSLLFLVSIIISCGDTKKSNTFQVGDEIVTQVSAQDEEMNAAMRKARATFSDFKDAFIKNDETNKYHSFTIKIGFDSPMYGKEHMWLENLRLVDGQFSGILFNKPTDPDVQYNTGDIIIIDPEQVSDWMYIEETTGIAHGGYTFRVMRHYLSDEEKIKFDELTELKFE